MNEQAVDTRTERKIRTGQTVRVVVWVVILALIVVFAAANSQDVNVDWVFGDSDGALWLVIGGSAAAGFLLGLTTARRRA